MNNSSKKYGKNALDYLDNLQKNIRRIILGNKFIVVGGKDNINLSNLI